MANQQRLIELDVLRGLAVAVMIIVVSPGSWSYTYAPLQHADWHGWTFADLVFPDFLFGVGMALGLTFGRRFDAARSPAAFWGKVAKRVTALILLGLALNYLAVIAGHLGASSVGPTDEVTWRIPGVLQRIALAYLLAMLVVVFSGGMRESAPSPRLAVIAFAIGCMLVLYWSLLTFVPVPGYGAGQLDKAGNLAAYLDRAVFSPEHMWPLGAESWRGPVVYDPEGILATLPASTNILFGVLAAGIWSDWPRWRMPALMAGGMILITLALLADPLFPINKKIWTSSFVLLTSGISFLALAGIGLLLRARLLPLFTPLKMLGGNAILAFSISIFLSALGSVPLPQESGGKNLQQQGFEFVQQFISDPHLASLACAFGILGSILLLIWPLDRKGIHLRL